MLQERRFRLLHQVRDVFTKTTNPGQMGRAPQTPHPLVDSLTGHCFCVLIRAMYALGITPVFDPTFASETATDPKAIAI